MHRIEPPAPSEQDTYVPPAHALDDSLVDLESLPAYSTKYTVQVCSKEDLERLCLKSDSAELRFPDLGIQEAAGRASYGTLRMLLGDVIGRISGALEYFVPGTEKQQRMLSLIDSLQAYERAEEEVMPFTLALYDPSSRSFIALRRDAAYESVAEDPLLLIRTRERQFTETLQMGMAESLIPDLQWEVTGKEDQDKGVVDEAYDVLLNAIRGAKKVVIFSGAGVSTESNLPAYRTPGGQDNIWDKYSAEDAHISNFFNDRDSRRRYWQMHMEFGELLDAAQPNPAHILAVRLQEEGKLLAVCTQNIDGLYEKAGLARDKLIELHGTCTRIICMADGCDFAISTAEAQRRWKEEEGREMLCDVCKTGLLKPDTISFGQPLDDNIIQAAISAHEECDLLLVMGSSLCVSPACEFPGFAVSRHIPLFLINLGETMYDAFAVVAYNEYVGKFSQRVLDALDKPPAAEKPE